MTGAENVGLIAARGTPEQIHLTWGNDPARTVVIAWASGGQAVRPRVRIGQRVVPATEQARAGGTDGTVRWTYRAQVDGLRPGATYGYAVTADNDANAADPFSATFTTAPEGRAAFRFTSFGDFAAPDPGAGSSGPAAYAVGAVETFQPLFHLFNGGLACGAGNPGALSPAARAQAWQDFENNVQVSAASRPWLPVPGGHGPGPGTGEPGPGSPASRPLLPPPGPDGVAGWWYAFRVGTVLFVCLSGDDVAYAGAGPPAADSAPQPAGVPGPGEPAAAGTPAYPRGYSGGAQTRWLEATLTAARRDPSVDWIIAALHPCACSSGLATPGSDLGVRREWLPLFETYEVDLVLSGHDDGYERSFPVHGFDVDAGTDTVTSGAADTRRPHPVTRVDSGVFDTSQGTVHLVLGCGGSGPRPAASAGTGPGASPRVARVLTRPGDPLPGSPAWPGGEAVETATWSARRDTSAAYGIAVFDVSPGGEAGGQTSVTVRYYHAGGAGPAGPAADGLAGPAGDYTLFDTFTLVRPRSDARRWHPRG